MRPGHTRRKQLEQARSDARDRAKDARGSMLGGGQGAPFAALLGVLEAQQEQIDALWEYVQLRV